MTVYVCWNVHSRCANNSRPFDIVSIENLEIEVFVYYFYLHIYYLAAKNVINLLNFNHLYYDNQGKCKVTIHNMLPLTFSHQI